MSKQMMLMAIPSDIDLWNTKISTHNLNELMMRNVMVIPGDLISNNKARRH